MAKLQLFFIYSIKSIEIVEFIFYVCIATVKSLVKWFFLVFFNRSYIKVFS